MFKKKEERGKKGRKGKEKEREKMGRKRVT
jgi:hypothetical protein